MIGTIRRHSKWLWFIIIAATITTFVFWGGTQGPRGNDLGRGGAGYGSIGGKSISQEDFVNAFRELQLRFFFSRGGEWPEKDGKALGFDMEKEPYYRLMLLQKASELNIHASSEAVAQVASGILRSINRGNPVPLDVFENQVLRPHGLTAEDFERFIRHDLELQQLILTVNLGGKLVTPQDAQSLYRRMHEELGTEAVIFTTSNYLAGVSVTPEAVAQFYTNNMAAYRLPERVQVGYVFIPASNFIAAAVEEISKITNLTARLEALYEQRGTNAYPDAKSPEEAKARILADEQRRLAVSNAGKAANEFARALFTNDPPRADHLEKLAKEQGLTVQVSAPFDRLDGPSDLKVRADFVKAAFALSADEPFAGPLLGEDGAYVIALNQRLPERFQTMEEIRERVTTDCKLNLALRQARQAGMEFYQTMTNSMAGGKTFAAICSEGRVHPVPLPPISLSTRELPEMEQHVELYQLKQVAQNTPVGTGNFLATADGSLVLYVQSRLPLDEAKMRADLPAFITSVQQSRQNEAFNLWFNREVERNMQDTPLYRRTQPSQNGAAAK